MQKKNKDLNRLQLHRETLRLLAGGQRTEPVNTAQTTPASICDIVCNETQPQVGHPVLQQTAPSFCDIVCDAPQQNLGLN